MKQRAEKPIYRAIELLYLELIPVDIRRPKSRKGKNPSTEEVMGSIMLAQMFSRLSDEFIDALTAVSVALNTKSAPDRLEVLGMLLLHLENIDSIVRTLHEWSSAKGQNVRLISRKQYAGYLVQLRSIFAQFQAWRSNTAKACATAPEA